MNDVPGFEDLSDSNENIAAVRGSFASTTNKILILINGHRMNSFELGRYNTDQFMGMDSVKQIEFIRGPGSALYGTGALTGVVNIITKTGDDLDGAYITAKGGSFNSEASVSFGKKIDDLDVFFNFSFIDAEGGEIDQPASLNVVPAGVTAESGQIYWNKYTDNWSAIASIKYDDLSLNIRKSHYSRATPRAPNGSFYDFDDEQWPPSYDQDDFLIDMEATIWLAEKGKLIINPSFHYIELKEQSWILSYASNYLPTLGSRSGQLAEEVNYGLKIYYEAQLNEMLNVLCGYEGKLIDFQRAFGWVLTDGTNITLNADRHILDEWKLNGIFGQLIITPTDQLNITCGLRWDDFEDAADSALTPRLGVIYKPTRELAIKALYGESVLAPSWAHGKTTPGYAFQSNPDLEPEEFKAFDFIVQYNTAKFNAWLDIFTNKIEGIITSDSTQGYQTYINYGESQYTGFELSSSYMVNDKLKLNASYSYVKDEDSDDQFLQDGDILNIPESIIRYAVEYLPTENLIFSLWGRTYSEVQCSDSVTGVTELDSWTTFDFTFNYIFNDWDFQVQVINLLDEEYEVAGTVTRPLARYERGVHLLVGKKF